MPAQMAWGPSEYSQFGVYAPPLRWEYADPELGKYADKTYNETFLSAIGLGGLRKLGRPVAKLPEAAKGAEQAAIQFGKVENQVSHTFRHVEKAGFDRQVVQDAIKQDLSQAAKSLSNGPYNGSVVVNGTKLDYTAFKLSDGTINVGRITPPKP